MAQARQDYFTRKVPTRVDIRPDSAEGKGFFGADGATFGDVLDAINPLNHIPIVSDIFSAATGHTASAASKLVGGTLLGGPIGFIASLANVIYEDATGTSPARALYAAITGDAPEATQVAASEPAAGKPETLAALVPASAPFEAAKIAPLTTAALTTKDKAVLELYGNSTASAHASYKRAQLRPYLQDVSVSRVL